MVARDAAERGALRLGALAACPESPTCLALTPTTRTLPLPPHLTLTPPRTRFDSIKYTLKEKKWNELARLVVHWGAFLAWLPAKTVFLGVWLSGLITATIVTVTHQSEEIFIKDTLRKYDFCEAQFRSTRDAMCSNWFSDALWGGMQWQLEHHLFPTMPRYKYKALHPLLRQWSQVTESLGIGFG